MQPSSPTVIAGATIALKAQLQRAPERTENPPSSLVAELTDPSSSTRSIPLMRNETSGLFEGTYPIGVTGVHTLVVKYFDAGLSSAPITLNAVDPTLTVTIQPAAQRPPSDGGTTFRDVDPTFANAHRRDEPVKITVSATDVEVDPDNVSVAVSIASDSPWPPSSASFFPVTAVETTQCATGATYCGTATVNLWEPQMRAFRSDFTVTAQTTVVSTLSPISGSASAKVTRFKWVHQAGGAIMATPAIAADGMIVVGTKNTINQGKVIALRPDGTVKWNQPLGSVTASPSITSVDAGSAVWVGVNSEVGAELHKLAPENGSTLASCGPYLSSSIETSIALDPSAGATEAATVLVNGAQELVRSTGCVRSTATSAQYPMGLVRQANSLYFGDSNGVIRAFDAFPAQQWASKSGWPSITYSLVEGLVVLGNEILWSHNSGVSAVTSSGTVSSNYTIGNRFWGLSIGTPDLVVVGSNSESLTKVQWSSKDGGVIGVGDEVQASPLHGRDGSIYTAAVVGNVAAWQRGAVVVPDWEIATLSTLQASPNIDCSRDESGAAIPGRPGVLYVASIEGAVYAFVVDDRGIDVNAPWPKYQHDPRNTGNADTLLADFSCP